MPTPSTDLDGSHHTRESAETDPDLGAPYRAETIELADDDEGPVVATLVTRPAEPAVDGGSARGAVLHVHGFCDYFFQTAAADYWTGAGYDFYAVDLRKYGRSLRPHQTPNFATDLAEYYPELDEAYRRITQRDGHDQVIVSAHSTGGLTASLWAADRRPSLAGMFLNAPWLDVQGPLWFRTAGVAAIEVRGIRQPSKPVKRKVSGLFTRSLHRDFSGEWDFNLDWKPVESFEVTYGWFRAIIRGHRRVAEGLDLPFPVLVLSSDRSYLRSRWVPEVDSSDIVLDVALMRAKVHHLSSRLTLNQIPGALHDVTLSRADVRAEVWRQITGWLEVQVSTPYAARGGPSIVVGEAPVAG